MEKGVALMVNGFPKVVKFNSWVEWCKAAWIKAAFIRSPAGSSARYYRADR